MPVQWSEARLREVLEAMFRLDGRGRITGAAVALYVVRSFDAVVCGCHADLPDAVAAKLEAIARRPRSRRFPEWERQYGDYLATLTEAAPITSMRGGPLYAFPDDVPDLGGVRIGPEQAEVLTGGLEEWIPDAVAGAPMAVSLEAGRAASVCASVRISPAIHCAGVETAPDRRRRGHAVRATAAWGRLVREAGAEPCYGTTFDNLASQGVARKLGLILVGSEFSVAIASRPPG